MTKLEFDRETLKKGIALTKTVKSSVGDLSFSFSEEGLILFSFDNRSYTKVVVKPVSSDVESGYSSDEYYVFVDKSAIFDTDLENVNISVHDNYLSVVATGGGQTRRSSLKKRSVKSKRPPVPSFPIIETVSINKKDFDTVLKSVSCSAGVKDSKTEDDMRILQIHFHGNGFVSSSTRFHASMCEFDGIHSINTSLVSADIPLIRSFCSKIVSEVVEFGEDSKKLYIIDPDTKSFLCLTKIQTEKPKFQSMGDDYSNHITIERSLFVSNLKWASLGVERTRRVTFSVKRLDEEKGELSISFQKQEANGIPVSIIKGDDFSMDVPVDNLVHIVSFIEGDVLLKYGSKSMTSLIELSTNQESDDSVKSRHFMTAMV